MEQVIKFNPTTGGNTPDMCLANVCKGFGIPNKYGSAWEAWEHTQQHSGNAPAGLDAPVFFSYTATIDGVNKNWGHIGVRLASGQFWSDGNIYSSIDAYMVNHWPKYVGWGESINDVTIIKGEDMDYRTSPPVFNADYYNKMNPDVAAHKVDATAHWLASGIKEGRPSAPNFHVKEYVANYSDLARVFGSNYPDAVKHYFNSGIEEGRHGTAASKKAVDDLNAKIADLENQLKAKQAQSQQQASESVQPPAQPVPQPGDVVSPAPAPTPVESDPAPAGQGVSPTPVATPVKSSLWTKILDFLLSFLTNKHK